MAETKSCEVCDQEIGASETKCPKCGTDFQELEQEVTVVQRAQAVAAKRKAKETPAPALEPAQTAPIRKSIFASLGKVGQ